MERDNYNTPQFESAAEKSDEGEDSSKKKKAKRAQALAHLVAKQSAAESDVSAAKPKEDEPSLWDKLTDKDKGASGETTRGATDGELGGGEVEAAEEVSDAEAPLEELSQDEQLLAMQAYVEARLQELSEQPEEDAAAEAGRTAAIAWLQSLRERLAEAGPDEATAEVEESYDAATAELTDDDDGELPDDTAGVGPEGEPDDDAAAPRSLTPGHAIPLAGGGAGRPPAAGSGGGSLPPRPPRGTPAASPLPPRGPASGPDTPGRPERLISENDAYYYERKAQQRGLLVGGLVGYLIGRRRGRIKTEKRLAGVQKKLEHQVIEAQQQISQKEDQLKQQARTRYQRQASAERPVSTSLPAIERSVSSERPPEIRRTEVRPAIETRQYAAEKSSPRPERPIAAPAAETARPTPDQLSRPELLEISGKIRFGETNLRRVYEAKLVDEAGLRRLVREYYQGHDLRRSLAREFLAKELRFERDPRLHGHGLDADQPGGGGSHASTVATDDQTADPAVPSRGSASQQSARQTAAPARRQTDTSPTLIIGLAVLTVALAIYAIWLTVTR